MRISTNTIYQGGGQQLSDLSSALYTTQQQLSTGRKILSPADDPVGSARALVITQFDAVNDQFSTNRSNVKASLSDTDGTLASVTSLLQSSKSLIVQAGNTSLTPSDRASIATQLQGSLGELLGLANAQDGTGSYMFSGFSTSTKPYTQTANGATYNGDQGQRMLQVDTSRQLPLSDTGPNVFGNIRTSATTFNAIANSANTGTATISATVNSLAALTGDNYSVKFTSATTFDVTDTTTGAVVAPGVAYTSGTPVTVAGMNITITNGATAPVAPASGDTFIVQPGNQNIFETFTDVINALKNGNAATPQGQADLQAALGQANSNIDKSLDIVNSARTKVGSSLAEIDTLDNAGSQTGINLKAALSNIQDLDYAKAITTLSQQQITLQAAQKSFLSTTQLSLFALLP